MIIEDDNDGWTTIDLDALDDFEDEDEQPKKKPAPKADDEDDANDDDVIIIDEEDEEELPKAKAKEAKPSRSESRIRQLVAQKKEADAKAAELERKVAELEAFNANKIRENAKVQESLIEDQLKSLSEAKRKAYEENDYDRIAEIDDKMGDLKINKRIAAAQAAKPEVKVPDKKPVTEELSNLPEEMQYWIEANPWAVKPETREDRDRVRAVRRLNRELMNEGYSEMEADFFDELDARLEKEFASEGGNGVQYKEKDTKSSSSDVKKRTSPVSAASRAPASRRDRISLTSEERVMAERLGIDPKAYALRKKAREDSSDGWATI